jgi:intein/homing endonuclease
MIKSLKRTKEEVDLFYKEYVEGYTLKEINLKYNTDAHYQFKKYNYPIRKTTITKKIREAKNITNYYYSYNYNFNSINNETEAYILGWWFSDGWVTDYQAGLKIHKNDKDILIKIKNYICKDIKLQYSKNNCAFVISSAEVIKNLINLGCLKNKTYLKLNIPNMNDSLIRHFIRGYFDGDGTIYKDRKWLKCNICSINKNFLEDIQKILSKNNIYSTINVEKREGKLLKTPAGNSINCKDMYRLFIRKTKDFKLFYNYLYNDSNIFLQRKYIKFNNGNIVLTN